MDKIENTSVNNNEIQSRNLQSKNYLIWKYCRKNFQEFSSSTSLHGVQYLAANNRSIFQRLWWAIIILISVTGCGLFIHKAWNKWNETPAIVTFDGFPVPVSNIPFPAITICPTSRIMQTQFNTSKYLHASNKESKRLDETEKFKLMAISDVCDFGLSKNRLFVNESTVNFLKSVSHSEHTQCLFIWKNYVKRCDEFNPRFRMSTEAGFCHTFNGLQSLFKRKIFQYTEYADKKIDQWILRQRIFEFGYHGNLLTLQHDSKNRSALTLDNPNDRENFRIDLAMHSSDIDYYCNGGEDGYRISLHYPSDFPKMKQESFMAPVNHRLNVFIEPKIVKISPTLMDSNPERRQCYFPFEKNLKYFRMYSQQNCEWECLSNYTLQICGCVAFWMPREKRFPICSSGKRKCMADVAFDDMEELDIKYEYAKSIGDTEKMKSLKHIRNECDCMASCMSIFYKAETIQTYQDWEKKFETVDSEDSPTINYSVVSINFSFKKSYFITSVRSDFYGIGDFLANCGGILGLFLGFSILSAFELFYFSCIRPIFALKNNLTKDKISIA